jgi:AbrB family looped-hinge helix DNA binding protein
MRITSKGQVTIPVAIREMAGLMPNTDVDFDFDGKYVRIRRAIPARKGGRRGKGRTRGERLIQHMRKHRGDVPMTTEEIMALTRGE